MDTRSTDLRHGDAATAPLSFSQEALWFLDQLAGPNGSWNIALNARLTGVHPETLQRSLQALIERHDPLRTAFVEHEGEPRQHVVDDATIALPIEDLGQIPAGAREEELARRMHERALEPFDLSCAPLLRARLFRLAGDEYELLIVAHHIVSDGWSRSVIARELAALYHAFERGAPAALPPLPVSFGRFARWQRSRARDGALQPSLDYWIRRLAGIEPIALPYDRPRPGRAEHRGGTVAFEIGARQLAALKALALRENATLYMTLLAAFQTLLMRYSGQTDIAVGTSVAGRSRPDLEKLVGFFVNALVMRTDLSGDPGFAELLRRVRAHALDAYTHQDLPFDVLVRHLNPDRDIDRNPLYQVAFVLQNLPDCELQIGSRPARLEPFETGTAKFDLWLVMTETAEGLHAHLTYSADLFERATIERMAAHFRNLVDAIVANPQAKLSALALMDAPELEHLLVGCNDTARDYPLHLTLHQLF
ncbi:MAG: condensation domain-containing protein, partial [Burkholderiaceae bacterium]|nr:condensation domain-containing protein [Burkholderiaceae bacterium]